MRPGAVGCKFAFSVVSSGIRVKITPRAFFQPNLPLSLYAYIKDAVSVLAALPPDRSHSFSACHLQLLSEWFDLQIRFKVRGVRLSASASRRLAEATSKDSSTPHDDSVYLYIRYLPR